MAKKKQDPSKAGLGSAQVEGQGTTMHEMPGGVPAESSRKRSKK